MPSAVKRGRPPQKGLAERRREEILRVATSLFASAGYACTDLQDVADKLGIGKGTLYRYFPTKQALFHAAVERAIMGMQSAIDAAIARLTEPLDRIGCAVRAYLGYFDRNPECIELLMQERAQFPERKKPKYFEHREANRGAWEKLYRDLIAQGYFRDIPVQRITDTVGALVYGAMFTNYFAGRRKGLAEQAEDILDVVFNGLLTQTGKDHRRLAAAKERES